jgi:hypothetical protein
MSTTVDMEEGEYPTQEKSANHQALTYWSGEMDGLRWRCLMEYRVCARDFGLDWGVYKDFKEAPDNTTHTPHFILMCAVYVQFKEGAIEVFMELLEKEEDVERQAKVVPDFEVGTTDNKNWDILLGTVDCPEAPAPDTGELVDVDPVIFREEDLTFRRSLLPIHVMLCQNLYSVDNGSCTFTFSYS